MTLRIVAAAAIVAAALLAVPAVRHWREQPPPPPTPPAPLRATLAVPDDLAIGAGAGYVFGLTLAADGRRLVYPAARAGVISLWLHDLATGAVRPLPDTDQAAAPFWSADGTRVGFFANGQLRIIDLRSGASSTLTDAPSPRGGAWNAAGDIVFAPSTGAGLTRRLVDGTIAPFTTLDTTAGETGHAWPAFLPDGRHVIFLVAASDRGRAGLWVAALDDPAARRRITAADAQALVAGATLLTVEGAALVARPLDPATFEPQGRGTSVASNVGRGPLGQVFATAADDVLMFGAPAAALRELHWISRAGARLSRVGDPAETWDLRIAPDGRRIVVTELDPQLRTLDVFIREGSQPVPRRLSLSTNVDESGVWSPDGLRIVWVGRRQDVMIRGAGAVLPEQTIASFDEPVQVWDWSPDGRALLVGRRHAVTGDDLWIQPPTEGAAATPYVASAFNQTYAAFSPDGRWVAYASDESGTVDIYIDSFPKPGTRVRVTTAGGTEPRWRGDGRELYFRRGAEVHAATLRTSAGGVEVTGTSRLFDAGAAIRAFDAARDGTRFLVNVPTDGSSSTTVSIALNWRSRSAERETPER